MMGKIIVIWLFIFNILTYSAFGSTCTEDFRNSTTQKHPKPLMQGTMVGSTKPCTQRKSTELNASQQTNMVSRIAKGIYRAPSNLRPRNVRNASNSNSIKPPSLFMTALKHLVFGLLLILCFYRVT
ncbi:hypothetical protein VNO78_23207 [Psophocarpus tetragonolobus]|uniref:Secreted protein n=1 Tax=Psophocarpus tetragonolobus TaxID=3891 RepID=A0AAN9S4G6_PSOTE